jgi:glycosyltransferase involved in cell wall biosynthesis
VARACFIRAWYYPIDPRVSREIAALVDAGHEVDVVCMRADGEPAFERLGGVNVHRLPVARRRAGLLRYLLEFLVIQVMATLYVGVLHARRRYDFVQVNSLPDWLVFAALIPKLLGTPVILDLHECMPEYAATVYHLPLSHPLVRLLRSIEQASIRFADLTFTCTEQMRERFVERGARADRLGVVLNSCDEERLQPLRYVSEARARADGRFVIVSHGTVDENFGIDVIVRAVARLRDEIPGLRLEIYGDGKQRVAIEALVRELNCEDLVWLSRRIVPHAELLPRIAEADMGVVAIRRDAFRDLTHCNKMYELVALRKPIAISRTRAIEAYFGEDCFEYFESGDDRDLARAIATLYADPVRRERLVRRAAERAEPYRWIHQRELYLGLVNRVLKPSQSDRVLEPGQGEPVVVEAISQR